MGEVPVAPYILIARGLSYATRTSSYYVSIPRVSYMITVELNVGISMYSKIFRGKDHFFLFSVVRYSRNCTSKKMKMVMEDVYSQGMRWEPFMVEIITLDT